MAKQVQVFFKTKAGRNATGYSSDKGEIVHAIIGNNGKHGYTALCGASPKDWSEWEEAEATCEKCLKRLTYMDYEPPAIDPDAPPF
ncbi:hypothetical protein [Vibrio harveyi]|uniref:Uncharacterized protein n=1 Tax=Vibrio harveyi TaxID=669 RepID=A0A8B3DMK4_VIBHA|nr:hypothetical protein [Vibrio harveyi]RIW17922.1 hypothetical protein DS957_003915 [Vibrio harveyi]